MQKYLVEFIGTFFLLIAIFISKDPVTIFAVLTAMIYAGGPISSAHYNPAVTIAFWIRGKMSQKDVLPYIVAQFLAVVAGFYTTQLLDLLVATPSDFKLPSILMAELLGTFALVFVILNVATAKRSEGNTYFGIAIGLVVLGGIYLFGPLSGAAMNPAVAIALCWEGSLLWSQIWAYLLAEFAAAFIATYTFLYINGKE